MKIVFLIILVKLVLTADQQFKCLLEEPLRDQCIESIQKLPLESQIGPFLCTIAIERSLFQKAEQFCRNALWDQPSSYNYFRTLLIQLKFQEALQLQYKLFFKNPFDHNSRILQNLQRTIHLLPKQQQIISKWSYLDQAIYYFYANKSDNSLQKLNKYLNDNKKRQELIYEHFLMVRGLEKNQQYYDALTYITEIIKSNKIQHFYFHHLRGNLLMHHVQFTQAINSFNLANHMFDKKSNTGFSFSHYNAGLCYEKLGDVQEAIKCYEKSYLSYQSAQALNALGHASYSLFQQTDDKRYLQKAQQYYTKAFQKNNKYTVLVFNIGILKLSQDKISEAIEYFTSCIQMDDSLKSCKYGLMKAFFLNNQIEHAQDIINSLDKTEQTLADLLAIHYQLGYHDKALQLLENNKLYRYSQLLKWKGYNQYSLNRFDAAERSFVQAIEAGGKDQYTYTALGQTQLLQRKYQACVDSLEKAYQLDKREQTKQLINECKNHLNDDL